MELAPIAVERHIKDLATRFRLDVVSCHDRGLRGAEGDCRMPSQSDLEAKMAVVLKELARNIAAYLGERLPRLQQGDWWQDLVLRKLSPQQLARTKQGGVRELACLDLAALLGVLDANWWNLANRFSLPSETRHYLKELQTVRNRWAHLAADGESSDLVYRDVDTAQRFLRAIAPEAPVVGALDDLKRLILGQQAHTTAIKVPEQPKPPTTEPAFAAGSPVRLRSDPSKTGVVMRCLPGAPEDRFAVFLDNESREFYASQLLAPESTPLDLLDAPSFHAAISALQMVHPGTNSLFSLNAARIDFIPYQFRPVLKFLRADRPRLLIADSVGVGKTIEAGLILRELDARKPLRNVLILCPKPLVTEKKWETEMRRFSERFVALDGPKLQISIEETDNEGEWDPDIPRAIIPFSLLENADLLHGTKGRHPRKGLLELDPKPRFDLVIVDEAHHIRNENTYVHQAVRFFCENADAVVFLTATPLQLGQDDLFVLLNTLRPDLVIDRESFADMSAPNAPINRAVSAARGTEADWKRAARSALQEAASTPWGRAIYPSTPDYKKAVALLEAAEEISDHDRVALITALENLHSFAGIVNRTRRRDIGDFTVRKPETIAVRFTEEQRSLHDALLTLQADLLARRHDALCVAFLMTTIRRQAASCIFGLAPHIGDILSRNLVVSDAPDDGNVPALDDATLEHLGRSVDALTSQARQLPPDDPKLDALLALLATKRKEANPRVMVFSTFRHTLGYLERRLSETDLRVGLIHGDIDDRDRVAVRRRFKQATTEPDAVDVLLFSEVGCEGLDYQFCDTLVNYDLPWNPMRIEQRIGRIDRNGQRSEFVRICNLVTEGTIDADIYERCLLRIGVFERSIGECEGILGGMVRDIERLAQDVRLSDEERRAKLQQLSDNKLRELQEQERLEKDRKAFFGLDLSDQRFRDDIASASSYWLGPQAIENLLDAFLRRLSGTDASPILGSGDIRTLRLSRSVREELVKRLNALKESRSNRAVADWRRRLAGDDPHIRVTFSASAAVEEPVGVELLSPLHPLIQAAARELAPTARIVTALSVRHPAVPPGRHPFALYEWRHVGLRPEVRLVPVCDDDAMHAALVDALAQAGTARLPSDDLPGEEAFRRLENRHHPLWSTARERHREGTREWVEHRARSLQSSHEARLRLLQDRIRSATDDRIRRSFQASLDTAGRDYATRKAELDTALQQADIHATPVAWGVLIGGEA